MKNVPSKFGSMVFNDEVMRERLPKDVYKSLHKTIESGKDLDLTLANTVANAMKDWAIEKGATHFTHWFQPMTGITAEKHDSFISPTADGNIIVGPNAESDNERDDVSTTRDGLDFVAQEAAKTSKLVDYRENIRSFAGLRANSDKKDFIIGESALCRHFINVAGIKSPGLSSSPAIGEYVIEILEDCGLIMTEKADWSYPEPHICFAELSNEEKAEICKRNPKYGNVICRCNVVTEGEILDALENSFIKPRTLDGIKRRTGTGMGRCQGGFCGVRVHEILCKYYGVDPTEILWDKDGSNIVAERVGENND